MNLIMFLAGAWIPIQMIELLINGYEYYENERKSKDDENN